MSRTRSSSPSVGRAAATLVLTAAAARWIIRQRRKIRFTGRIVAITGGSRGLGLTLARAFTAEGATVALLARDESELDRARAQLEAGGKSAHTYVCDVGNAEQVRRAIRTIELELGPIDVLVNNAGIITVGPMRTMTPDDYTAAMRTHFWGPLYAIDAVLPTMRARRFGRIVNIASIGGKISVPHLLPYSASKFALVGLSEGLRGELRRENIFVTTICPGLMRTGSPRNVTVKGQHELEYAWFVISDSVPGPSISVRRAAQRILEACRYGEAEVVIGLPARVAAWIHGLWPGLTADALATVNRVLPGPGARGRRRRTGAQSRSRLTPPFVTALTDRAAVENNEVP